MGDEFENLLGKLDRLYERQQAEREVSERADPKPESAEPESSEGRLDRVAQYRLGRVLGGGGFGIVYLANDEELNREVALKLPRLDALFDLEKRQRFAAEAMTAARLVHPGIVRIYDANLDGLMPYIASEFCDGPNLAQWMEAKETPPPWRQCLELVAKVADAVDYAHQNKVFHRDLKPANIMITRKAEFEDADQQSQTPPDDTPVPQKSANSNVNSFANWELDQCQARLTDFGLAKLADSSMTETRTSQMMGTPLYMAPEQVERQGKESNNAAADIYSLGVILFELLTGQMPIAGSSYVKAIDNIRTMPPLKVSEFRQGLPRDVERICAKCLEKNPEARYLSAQELAEDLRRCVQGEPVLGKRAGVLSRAAYWCTRPHRVETAGWFVISWVSLMAVWVIFNVLALPAHAVVTMNEFLLGVRDLAVLLAIGVVPIVWLGWKVVQGKTWALWVIVAISVFRTPMLIRAMVAEPVYFSTIYKENPLFSFVDHSMMVIATCIQLFLCVCGLLAKKKMERYLT